MSALFESWTGLALLDPWMLTLALFVPASAWLRRRRGDPALTFSPATLFEGGLPRSWRTTAAGVAPVVQGVGLLLVALCLARPVHRVQLPRDVEGIDILLCLDASSSMAARDLDGEQSRLEVAKAAAARFVAARPSDRIGLVRFARYPDLVCPLTLDHRALQTFLAQLELVELEGPEDLTGIGTAVARAAQVLRSSMAESRVVVLLTDGEENVATAQTPDEIGPSRAARVAEQLGIRVYTIAAGRGRPTPEGGWSALDTSQVQALAEQTGGAFYEARDAAAIDSVYAAIDELETVPFEEPRYVLVERFQPFLAVALALVMLARWVRSGLLGGLP